MTIKRTNRHIEVTAKTLDTIGSLDANFWQEYLAGVHPDDRDYVDYNAWLILKLHSASHILEQLPLDHDGVYIIPGITWLWHPDDICLEHPELGARVAARNRGGRRSKRLGPWEAVPGPNFHWSEWTRRSVRECYTNRKKAEAVAIRLP